MKRRTHNGRKRNDNSRTRKGRTRNSRTRKGRTRKGRTRKGRTRNALNISHYTANYTKKAQDTRRRRRRRVDTRSELRTQDGGDGGILIGSSFSHYFMSLVVPLLLDGLKDYLESKCVETAQEHKLKDSAGNQIKRCGLFDLKNSREVVKWLYTHYRAKIKRYKKVIVPIFMKQLEAEGFKPSFDLLKKLRSSENRDKLKTVVRLTLEDPSVKDARDGDIGLLVLNAVKAGRSDLKKKSEGNFKKILSSGRKSISRFREKSESPLSRIREKSESPLYLDEEDAGVNYDAYMSGKLYDDPL